MASHKDHVIVLVEGTKVDYSCKCGWTGNLTEMCEHMMKNQPDLTKHVEKA